MLLVEEQARWFSLVALLPTTHSICVLVVQDCSAWLNGDLLLESFWKGKRNKFVCVCVCVYLWKSPSNLFETYVCFSAVYTRLVGLRASGNSLVSASHLCRSAGIVEAYWDYRDSPHIHLYTQPFILLLGIWNPILCRGCKHFYPLSHFL